MIPIQKRIPNSKNRNLKPLHSKEHLTDHCRIYQENLVFLWRLVHVFGGIPNHVLSNHSHLCLRIFGKYCSTNVLSLCSFSPHLQNATINRENNLVRELGGPVKNSAVPANPRLLRKTYLARLIFPEKRTLQTYSPLFERREVEMHKDHKDSDMQQLDSE